MSQEASASTDANVNFLIFHEVLPFKAYVASWFWKINPKKISLRRLRSWTLVSGTAHRGSLWSCTHDFIHRKHHHLSPQTIWSHLEHPWHSWTSIPTYMSYMLVVFSMLEIVLSYNGTNTWQNESSTTRSKLAHTAVQCLCWPLGFSWT